MGGDFNIRDAEWDPFVSSHPAAGQALVDLADSLGLVRSHPELPVPTHYSDTDGHANSVIDLIFLGMSCAQVLYRIEPDLRWPSTMFFPSRPLYLTREHLLQQEGPQTRQ